MSNPKQPQALLTRSALRQSGRAARGPLPKSTMLALESRVLFDGAGVATFWDSKVQADAKSAPQPSAAAAPDAQHEVVFIDSRVKDSAELVAGINPDAKVVFLDPSKNGLQQITDTLAQLSGITAVHIISNGADGQFEIGNSVADKSAIDASAAALASWQSHMAANGAILLYGGDIAQDGAGRAMVDDLSAKAGVAVAASTGETSAATDWNLEYATGDVSAALAVSAEAARDYADSLDSSDSTTSNSTTQAAGAGNSDSNGNPVSGTLGNQGNGKLVGNAGGSKVTSGGSSGSPLSITTGSAYGANEDSPVQLTGIQIADGQAGASETVTLSVAHGALSVSNAGGATLSGGSGTLSLAGTVDQVNAALANLSYQGGTHYYGADTLSISVTDTYTTYDHEDNGKGNAGEDNGNGHAVTVTGTVAATVGITVNEVNQAPTLTLPGGVQVNEGASVVISGLAVADGDANGSAEQVTLAVGQGVLNVTGPSALSVSGSGTGTVVLTGTLNDINTALGHLSYTGNGAFYGTDTLHVTVNDQGNTGAGGALTASGAVAIKVTQYDQAPTISVPGGFSGLEDAAINLSGIAVADVDSNGSVERVTLQVGQGTLAVGAAHGATVSDPGSNLVLTGTLAQINGALGTLTYTGNTHYFGTDTLDITVNDQSSAPGGAMSARTSVGISVTEVNQPPVLQVPTGFGGTENSLIWVNGIQVKDVDANGSAEQVTVSVSHGTLNINPGSGTIVTGGNSATLVLTGTLSQLASALGTLNYTPATGFFGTDTLNVTVNDLGDTGVGGAKTATASVPITVTAVAPAVGGQASFSGTENTPIPIPGIQVTDVSATGVSDSVTVNVGHGSLNLSAAQGVTVFGAGTGTLTLSGDLAAINASLASLSYQGNANFYGTDTLSVGVADTNAGGATARGGATFAINVAEAQPVLTVPQGVAGAENAAVPVRGLQVADLNATATSDTVTLSVGHGMLNLNGGQGVTISGAGTGTVTLTGDLASINSALATLSYQGNANFYGQDSLSISVSDQAGNDGPPSHANASVPITIAEAPPTLTLPSQASGPENAPFAISGIQVDDVNASSSSDSVTLSVANGALNIGNIPGVAVDGAGTGTLTLQGGLALINNALSTLTYQGLANFYGQDTLTVSVNDQAAGNGPLSHTSASLAITVTETPPSLTVPAAFSGQENGAIRLSGINVADVNAGGANGNVDAVTLSVGNGALNLGSATGVTVTGTGTGTLTVSGDLAAINTALATLSYRGDANFHGLDVLTVTVGDTDGQGNETGARASTPIAVAGLPPVLSLPQGAVGNENAAFAIPGVSVADLNATGSSDTVILSVANGTLNVGNAEGVGVSGAGTGTVTLSGDLDSVNTALATLSYQGNANFYGADTLTVHVGDQGADGSYSQAGGAITITVREAPPGLTVPTGVAGQENGAIPIGGIRVADVNATSTSDSVTLSVGNGTLRLGNVAGVTVNGAGSDTVTLSGDLALINNALATLSYHGNANFYGQDTLTVSVGDTDAAAHRTGALASVAITVQEAAPGLTLPQGITGAENSPIAISGISVTDVNAGGANGNADTVTVSVGNGTLSLGSARGVTVNGAGTGSLTLSGSLSDIDTALATLSYHGNANFHGPDTLTVAVGDQGADGSTVSASGSVAITVREAPPLLSAPSGFSGSEGTVISLSGVQVTDVNATRTSDTVTVSVANGVLSLGAADGVAVKGGGTNTMTLSGDLSAINAALNTLAYQGGANFYGSDTLSVQVDDRNAGGGAADASATIPISVREIPPSIAAPASVDGYNGAVIPIAGVKVADGNADGANGNADTVTLSVANGRLSLGGAEGVGIDGAGTGTVTLTGSLAAINRALAGLTYQASGHFTGADTLSLQVVDKDANGVGVAAAATVVVHVAADVPSAADMTVASPDFSATRIQPLGHASDPAGLPLSIAAVGEARHGTVALNEDGSITYTPTYGYVGADQFTYAVSDGHNGQATATVTIDGTGRVLPAPATASAPAPSAPSPTADRSPAAVTAPASDAVRAAVLDGNTSGYASLSGTATSSGNGGGLAMSSQPVASLLDSLAATPGDDSPLSQALSQTGGGPEGGDGGGAATNFMILRTSDSGQGAAGSLVQDIRTPFVPIEQGAANQQQAAPQPAAAGDGQGAPAHAVAGAVHHTAAHHPHGGEGVRHADVRTARDAHPVKQAAQGASPLTSQLTTAQNEFVLKRDSLLDRLFKVADQLAERIG